MLRYNSMDAGQRTVEWTRRVTDAGCAMANRNLGWRRLNRCHDNMVVEHSVGEQVNGSTRVLIMPQGGCLHGCSALRALTLKRNPGQQIAGQDRSTAGWERRFAGTAPG